MYSSFVGFINKKFNTDAHYFLHGGFWLTLTQGVVVVSGIITTALLANYLSPTSYGIYRYLLGLAIIFSSFSLTGLGQSILQAAAKKYYSFYTETIKINVIYSLGITISALVGTLYYWFSNNVTLAVGCLLIAIFQPIINIYQYTPTFLQGNGRFKESTQIQSTRIIVTSIITVGVLFLTKDILLLFFAYITSNAFINAVSYFWYRQESADSTPEKISRQYLSYAKHISFQNIISTFGYRIDTLVVFTQLGSVELAFYTIATVMPEQIKGSFKNLASLLLPKYAKHDNYDVAIKNVPRRSFQLLIILSSITIGYILAAPLFFHILFPKYTDLILYSQIYALAFPSFIALIPMSIIQSKLDKKSLSKINNQNVVIGILSVVILTFYFGLMGTIISRVVTRYVNTIYIYVRLIGFTRKKHKVDRIR